MHPAAGDLDALGTSLFGARSNTQNHRIFEMRPFNTLAAGTMIVSLSSFSHAALTGWWQFDDLTDSSGRGHDVTLHGDATLGAGFSGGGLVLDGDGDWADVTSSIDHQFEQGTNFTMTLFFNGPDTNTNDGLISKGYADNPRDPNGYYLLMVTDPGQYEFDSRCCAGGTPRARSGQVGPSLVDGAWHNITLVRDYGAGASGEIRSYIDGNLVNTIDINPTDGGDWNMGVNSEALTFGDHLNRFTEGSFDDIAIWKDEVLTDAQIADIAANGVPEPSSGILLALGGSLLLVRRRTR